MIDPTTHAGSLLTSLRPASSAERGANTLKGSSVHASSAHFGAPHGDSTSFFTPAMHTASEFPGGADFPGGGASVAVCGEDGVEDADLGLMDDFGLMDSNEDVETNVMEVWSEEDWLRQFQPGPPPDRDEKVGTTQGGRNIASNKVEPSSCSIRTICSNALIWKA